MLAERENAMLKNTMPFTVPSVRKYLHYDVPHNSKVGRSSVGPTTMNILTFKLLKPVLKII